jgi:MFS family permease
MGDFVAQTFVRGMLVTLIVVAAIEVLGMGDAGVGLLNGMIGLGGLVGALGALGLVGGGGLTRVFALALVGWGLPIALIGVWPAVAVAVCALFVTGISNAVLDVSGFTLVQRGVGNEDRVAVFGVFESGLGMGLLVGSLVAPGLVALFGARTALVIAGAILPLLALVTFRPIARRAGKGELTDELTHLLRSNPLFAPLPLTALDRLAEDVSPRSYEAGAVLMRKGDIGEHYLLIAEGEVEVLDDDRLLRVCGRGQGIGEIALLRKVPRTATVSARTHVDAYAIDAETFLTAVAGPAAAAAAESIASARLAHSLEQVEARTS